MQVIPFANTILQMTTDTFTTQKRVISAPRGSEKTCKSWQAEAAMRMLMNNLDPEVAERPDDLVVYGGRGKAARNWESYDAIIKSLQELEVDETLLVQSGKPIGIATTTVDAPRVIIANSNLVPHWGTQETFDDLEARDLMMYGQMTAGSYMYIGPQGIVHGTTITVLNAARMATSVFPYPTSPQINRSVGLSFSRSFSTSSIAFN